MTEKIKLIKKYNNQFTIEQLMELGLSQYSAKAYYALCGYDSLSAGDLAIVSGIPQSKIYEVARRLVYEGIVEEIITAKHISWKVMPINIFVEKKVRELTETIKFLQGIK